MQLLLILKPACCPSCNAPSLSKHCTNLLLRILQNTFPTTLSKVAGSSLSPFLNTSILTIRPSLHCLGTISSCHITENDSQASLPFLIHHNYLSNSPTIPSLPPVLVFLRHFALSPFSISLSKRKSVISSDKLL